MPLIIEMPKLKRFARMEDIVDVAIGTRMMAALKMVLDTGRKTAKPPKGKVTHAGEVRGHTFSDAAMLGLLDATRNYKSGQIVYLPNERTRRAVSQATVLKVPVKAKAKTKTKAKARRAA